MAGILLLLSRDTATAGLDGKGKCGRDQERRSSRTQPPHLHLPPKRLHLLGDSRPGGREPARVAQIVAETTPELPEDDGRAEIASLLEYAERKCVDLIEHPGFALTATGRVAEDPSTGEPLLNKQVVDNALRTLIVIADRRSKTFGLDKAMKRETPIEEAERQMRAVMAQIAAQKAADDAGRELTATERLELETLRRQAAAVPGEVIRELPPGGA